MNIPPRVIYSAYFSLSIFICFQLLAFIILHPVWNLPPLDSDELIHAMRSEQLWVNTSWQTWRHYLQWENPDEPELLYRPSMLLTFLLTYIIAPDSGAGTHIMGAIFHGLTAFLLYLFLTQVRLPFSSAVISAVLFIIHPALTSALCWKANTPYFCVSALFISCIILFRQFCRNRSIISLSSGLLLYLIGITQFETMLPFPILCIAVVEIFFPVRAVSLKRRLVLYGILLLLIFLHYAHIFYRLYVLDFDRGYQYLQIRSWDRILDFHLMPWEFVQVLFKAFLIPLNVAIAPTSMIYVTPLIGFTLLIFLALSAVPLHRKRIKLCIFGLMWAIITFIPTYPEVRSTDVVWRDAKYYYLPFVGIHMMIAALFPSGMVINRVIRWSGTTLFVSFVLFYSVCGYFNFHALILHSAYIQQITNQLRPLIYKEPLKTVVFLPFEPDHILFNYPFDMITTAYMSLYYEKPFSGVWYYAKMVNIEPGPAPNQRNDTAPFFPSCTVISVSQPDFTICDCTHCVSEWITQQPSDDVLFCEQNCWYRIPDYERIKNSNHAWHLRGNIKVISKNSLKLW